MRTTTTLLAAACLSAGFVIASLPAQAADTAETSGVQNKMSMAENAHDNIALPAGVQVKDLHEMDNVRSAFKNVTEDAFGKDPLNDVISCTVDQDRERLKATNTAPDKNGDALTSIVKKLDSAWNTKYHHSFSIDSSKVYIETNLHIVTGEVTNPEQLVNHWPLKATANSTAQGDLTAQGAQDANKLFGGEVNLDKGRNVAVARLIGTQGMPAIDASLIHELPSAFRFDIPNTITRQQVYNNLLANLTHLYSKEAQWPADPTDAYRDATYAVVASLYGVNMDHLASGMNQATTPPSQNMPMNGTPAKTVNER